MRASAVPRRDTDQAGRPSLRFTSEVWDSGQESREERFPLRVSRGVASGNVATKSPRSRQQVRPGCGAATAGAKPLVTMSSANSTLASSARVVSAEVPCKCRESTSSDANIKLAYFGESSASSAALRSITRALNASSWHHRCTERKLDPTASYRRHLSKASGQGFCGLKLLLGGSPPGHLIHTPVLRQMAYSPAPQTRAAAETGLSIERGSAGPATHRHHCLASIQFG